MRLTAMYDFPIDDYGMVEDEAYQDVLLDDIRAAVADGFAEVAAWRPEDIAPIGSSRTGPYTDKYLMTLYVAEQLGAPVDSVRIRQVAVYDGMSRFVDRVLRQMENPPSGITVVQSNTTLPYLSEYGWDHSVWSGRAWVGTAYWEGINAMYQDYGWAEDRHGPDSKPGQLFY